jgi:hypothetical protein
MPIIHFNIPVSTSCASNAADGGNAASEHDLKTDLHSMGSASPQASALQQHFTDRADDLVQQLRGYTASSITDDIVRVMALDLIKSGVKAVLQDEDNDEIIVLASKTEFETMLGDEDDEDVTATTATPPTPCAFARSSIPRLDAIFDSKGVVIATWEMNGSIIKAVTLQSFHPDRSTNSLIQTEEADLACALHGVGNCPCSSQSSHRH